MTLSTSETPLAAWHSASANIAWRAGGLGGYHSAVESLGWRELKRQWRRTDGRTRTQTTSSCFHPISSSSSAQHLHLCLCARPTLFLRLSSSSIHPPPPSLSSLLARPPAPLSSCFSGFLNCDISPPSPLLHLPPSSYCPCSSSSSPLSATCGKSN